MCGHFALDDAGLVALTDTYALEEGEASAFRGEYFPSRGASHQTAPVLLRMNERWILRHFRWDLVPSWWDRPLEEKTFASFNARMETLAEKPVFRGAWQKRQRALVPATAFYEWPDPKRLPPGIRRQEYRIRLIDRSFFTIAALWDVWVDPLGKPLYSFSLITMPDNGLIAALPHDRMPVILPPKAGAIWVDPEVPTEEAAHLLSTYPKMSMTLQAVEPKGRR